MFCRRPWRDSREEEKLFIACKIQRLRIAGFDSGKSAQMWFVYFDLLKSPRLRRTQAHEQSPWKYLVIRSCIVVPFSHICLNIVWAPAWACLQRILSCLFSLCQSLVTGSMGSGSGCCLPCNVYRLNYMLSVPTGNQFKRVLSCLVDISAITIVTNNVIQSNKKVKTSPRIVPARRIVSDA